MARRVTKGKNELIFTYLDNGQNANISVATGELNGSKDGEKVDVEIILLGPKRKKKSRRSRDEDDDDDERSRTNNDDDDNEKRPNSSADETAQKSTDEAAPKRVNDTLLKQLERRYQASGGALGSEDDAYVDYMDYF